MDLFGEPTSPVNRRFLVGLTLLLRSRSLLENILGSLIITSHSVRLATGRCLNNRHSLRVYYMLLGRTQQSLLYVDILLDWGYCEVFRYGYLFARSTRTCFSEMDPAADEPMVVW